MLAQSFVLKHLDIRCQTDDKPPDSGIVCHIGFEDPVAVAVGCQKLNGSRIFLSEKVIGKHSEPQFHMK